MPVSGPYILQVFNQVKPDPDYALRPSPLWPLQSALRAAFAAAANNSGVTSDQISRVSGARSEVESLFAQWRVIAAVKLRAAIRASISPPNLDLANDPVLNGFQTMILALPQWGDSV